MDQYDTPFSGVCSQNDDTLKDDPFSNLSGCPALSLAGANRLDNGQEDGTGKRPSCACAGQPSPCPCPFPALQTRENEETRAKSACFNVF
jgi:hypothetical protein